MILKTADQRCLTNINPDCSELIAEGINGIADIGAVVVCFVLTFFLLVSRLTGAQRLFNLILAFALIWIDARVSRAASTAYGCASAEAGAEMSSCSLDEDASGCEEYCYGKH